MLHRAEATAGLEELLSTESLQRLPRIMSDICCTSGRDRRGARQKRDATVGTHLLSQGRAILPKSPVYHLSEGGQRIIPLDLVGRSEQRDEHGNGRRLGHPIRLVEQVGKLPQLPKVDRHGKQALERPSTKDRRKRPAMFNDPASSQGLETVRSISFSPSGHHSTF